ncbi:MAG: MFS transporter [Pseudomonadota bacterium]
MPWPTLAAVLAIGTTQIISWGSSFYVLGVLGGSIADGMSWPSAVVFGGFTLSVLVSSLISTWAGNLMDRSGARTVMAIGFIVLAASLWLLAQVQSVWQYFAVWTLIGVAMRLTLYDAAFAAAVQVDPANGKRGIAYLTLAGGFASTVGWLIGHELNSAFGWRATLEWFAAANLLLGVPLVLSACGYRAPQPLMPNVKQSAQTGTGPTEHTKSQPASSGYLTGRARTVAMVLFAIVMSSNAINFGVAAVHLVTIIEATGIALGVAVGLASMKGIAQVAARLFDIVFGAKIPPMQLGRFAIACLALSFAILLLLPSGANTAAAFVIVFGIANGLATIVRGTVPLALFGPDGYGRILGILATPFLLFNALAPLGFSMIADAFGPLAATWVIATISLFGIVMMEVLVRWYERLHRSPTKDLS